ncbi:glycosyltransferase family A protein [Pectobacterium carotovorum]|uniref:glycosyltransferase family 2 protein n=1 Tax=Pectobacterium carotovorum TaxID=554 RepID=UPI00301AB9A3
MLVSIIMPAYNAERYICDAIDSVMQQSYSNFELIVCDDGSTDNTALLVKSYTEKDSRITLIVNQCGKGAAGSRNSAIKKSSGEFLAFLDSDDMWHKDKLKEHINFMITNDLSISHTNYFMFDSYGKKKLIKSRNKVGFDEIIQTCDLGCLTVMINKKKISNVFFPLSPKEDYALWLTLMKNGEISYLLDKELSYYRKIKGSSSYNKIKELKKQYFVLRNFGALSFIQALYQIVKYIFHGVKKHYF